VSTDSCSAARNVQLFNSLRRKRVGRPQRLEKNSFKMVRVNGKLIHQCSTQKPTGANRMIRDIQDSALDPDGEQTTRLAGKKGSLPRPTAASPVSRPLGLTASVSPPRSPLTESPIHYWLGSESKVNPNAAYSLFFQGTALFHSLFP